MSIEAVAEFQAVVNANKDWQEEIRNLGADDDIVTYAKSKGIEFTNEEYNEFVEAHVNGELSEFEMELVAGGMGGKASG